MKKKLSITILIILIILSISAYCFYYFKNKTILENNELLNNNYSPDELNSKE